MQTNRLMLVVAIAAGVIAMAAAFGYLRSVSGASAAEAAEPGVDILVAASDLPPDHVIDPANDFKSQKVPSRTFATMVRSAVKADERGSLRGRRLSSPVPAGMPLTYADLVSMATLDISPGSRAMSISVDTAGTLGGLLVPGDRVDVVLAWQLPKEKDQQSRNTPQSTEEAISQVLAQAVGDAQEPREWGARTLLSNVRVLAIGQSLNKSREQFVFEDPGRASGGTQVVTIELTPDEALELVRATGGNRGKLTLLLRPAEGAAAPPAAGSTLQ
jgi:pilus assembly protein CpaB